MKNSSHRMAHLTSQLLAYARGGKYNAKTISFSDILKETLPLIINKLSAAIKLESEFSTNGFLCKG